MKLLSFGCSFMFGCELPDNTSPGVYSRQSWPALFAQHHGWDYHCLAEPGSGNLCIAHNVLNHLDQDAVFVIGWTWGDRFDFAAAGDKWNTILPADQDQFSEFFYRWFHSLIRDKLTSLVQINLVLNELQKTQRRFIMTYQDSMFLDQKYHVSPAIIRLQNQIRPHLHNFNGLTFLEWARSQNFPVSDLWHPLADAHRAAAQYAIESRWV